MQAPIVVRRLLSLIRKAAVEVTSWPSLTLSNVTWPPRINEPFSGAWQRNITPDSQTSILAFSAVFACVTGIASDVAKMRIKLTEEVDGIYKEITKDSPWLPVLRKPNRYQNRIQFISDWIVSKLLYGNAYVLKERKDKRGIVTAMYVLNPMLVTPLVTEDGSVYYRLGRDFLAGVSEENFDSETPVVPASEIIHDRMCCLWHPLVGVSPIYACAVSATMGNRIQANSTNSFGNGSRPGGILTAPAKISDETAARLKKAFEENFSGPNVGRLAVLGDGLKFEPMTMSAESNQLIEQLKWTVEDVGRCFHYPAWKLNSGSMPPYSSGPDALTTMYYTDCLQPLIEPLELCLDEGLELPSDQYTELDLDNLLRMDIAALFESNNKAVNGGWMKPDEARKRANLPSVAGGDSPYLQQQNYSLAALAKRDALADPFATSKPAAPALPPSPTPPAEPAKSVDLEWLEKQTDLQVEKEFAFA